MNINEAKKTKIIKNTKIMGKILIIAIFIIASLFITSKHEPWSDEAQSFLLAKDNSLIELFGWMKYEGTPPLWVLVLKLFIFLGGTFELLWILPIIFTTIGLIIFEFKIKAPWYIKILLPFTYFIFYQYTVVARSYCMVFPLLMLIATIYDKRLEKPILYSIVLWFFMNISLHTLVISGSLYLIFLIDVFKNKKFKEKKIVIACILIFMQLFLGLICTFPAKDCGYNPKTGADIEHVILEATLGSNFHPLVEDILAIIIAEILIFTLKKNQVINFFILFLPVTAILMFITFQGWHIGILWILIFTSFIINKSINENIVIKVFVVLVCFMQIYWSYSSASYDINNNYSGGEKLAEFIKYNNYDKYEIYGLGYSITAIQPYFDHNIFANQNTDKRFYSWKEENGYMDNKEVVENEADIYIVSKFYTWKYRDVMAEISAKGYKAYQIDGYTHIKDYLYESEGYFIYIKEGIPVKLKNQSQRN